MLGARKCSNRNKSSIVGIYPGLNNSTLYSSFYVANRNNILSLEQFIAPQFLLKKICTIPLNSSYTIYTIIAQSETYDFSQFFGFLPCPELKRNFGLDGCS